MRTDTTVEPSSIHRRHTETVFLTDVQPASGCGAGGFRAAAILPAGHAYYAAHTAPANQRLDPMLVLEACRQAHNYLAHTYFDVPGDAAFILNAFALRLAPDAYTRMPPTGTALLEMTLPAPGAQRAGSRTRSLTLEFALVLGDDPIGRASISVGYASAAAYRTLRTRCRGDAVPTSADLPPADRTGSVPPPAVGRTEPADVLLADLTGDRARLIVPVEHTGLFDHPLDHVPGTLLIEAARQLATALSPDPRSAVLRSMSATFQTFAELDAPVELTSTALGGELIVTATQSGTAVATIATDIA
ncbi:ScbA/BarX family gamma-butyrolactone biosynthesis protein [Paractinoplanes ferrugineus]|uniref:Adhesin n=1 Tax=Paractinoplanes ferrugineus TaxID=113564 RepID=A0A919MI33_9ACTN|nr:ScbA/BarX family gamma-butyrolactone biosynthesis protein [Actinoplanes ferrugineus]GIE16458.1 adhesin [Actinoplanes ferrugineus]